MKPVLRFDKATHAYWLDNRPVPSVTGVINDLRPERFEVDQFYLDRGSVHHTCVKLMLEGRLKWESVDERIRGRVKAVENFLRDCNCEVLATEQRILSSRYLYAGTMDALLRHRPTGRIGLADWKGTLDPWAQLQLGAYSLAWAEEYEKPGVVIGVELHDDGSYKSIWGTRKPQRDRANFNLDHAERGFLAALTYRNWLVANKQIKATQNTEVIAA